MLDIGLPDVDGLTLCRRLKDDPATSWIGVVLLTGAGEEAEEPAGPAGADAFLRKPFSPLELLAVVERLAGGLYEGPFAGGRRRAADEQLLLYANDLRRLLEIERGRQELLQRTYRQTVAALAGALESKDFGTGTALAARAALRDSSSRGRSSRRLLHDPSVEYGFLLHDVGKIGIPDHVLQKRGPLDDAERRLMRTHTVLGEQLLGDVDLLHGDGLQGRPRRTTSAGTASAIRTGSRGAEIPLAARIFAVADALDAMTSDRPYRARAHLGRGGRRDPRRARAPVRPGRRGRVLRARAGLREHPARAGRGLSDSEAFRRLYDHLEPGGALVLDNEVPYADAALWQYWLKEKRGELPRPRRDPSERRIGSDGTEYALQSRLVEFDPLAGWQRGRCARSVARGELVAEEEHLLTERRSTSGTRSC